MKPSKIRVQNMVSDNGNSIPNQFIITTGKGRYFQSYDSIICFIDNNRQTYLDAYYWNYSRTTSKYRNLFLGMDTKETEKAIKDKRIKLTNLNK